MTFTFTDLLQSLYGVAAFSLFGFAPGYLVSGIPLCRPALASWLERTLWSLVLSLPLSILLCLNLERYLSQAATLRLFEGMGAAAAILLLLDLVRRSPRQLLRWSREATIVCFAILGLTVYGVLAPLGIQIHHRLYESAVSQDWNVRAQLVYAAMRSSVSPHNPMFAIAGQAPPLHYYFYWYVLCAHLCRLTAIAARPALAASCVWASFSLLACIFLGLKYMGPSRANLRRLCAVSLLVACVLGLDVIPATVGFFMPRRRLYPDIEFWLDDRSPSWLAAILWSPHHVAGFTFCIAATLILFLMQRQHSWPRLVAQSILAATLFAAAVGTSTYIVCFFVLASLFVLTERLWRREWRVCLSFVLVGLLTLLLSRHFIVSLLASQTATAVSSGNRHNAMLFMLRSNRQANHIYLYFTHPLSEILAASEGKATTFQHLVRLPTILLMYLAEFGFYTFVLVHRIRNDFRRKLEKNELWLWLIFLAFALPGFTISSLPLQGNNDLGRHAGMCMRFILLIWAVPLVESFLSNRADYRHAVSPHPWLRRVAVGTFILGLAAQLWQITINRLYIPLVDRGLASTQPALRVAGVSHRYYEIREAMQAAEDHSGINDIVQGNPQGRLHLLFLLYASRQMAASDTGCAVPFGGDPAKCEPVAKSLVALFGGSGPPLQGHGADQFRLPHNPAMVTPQSFRDVCMQQSIKLLVASYTDPAWHMPESWVWTETPIFKNSTARVYQCSQTVSVTPSSNQRIPTR